MIHTIEYSTIENYNNANDYDNNKNTIMKSTATITMEIFKMAGDHFIDMVKL